MAEEVSENGIEPRLKTGSIITAPVIGVALKNSLESIRTTCGLHTDLKNDSEAQKHSGLMANLDLSIKQETYEADEIKDWLK